MTSYSPTAIDLFCGCGGISVGLRDAGFSVIAGVDIEPNYITSFAHNFPEAYTLTADLSKIDPCDFLHRMGLKRGELDLLAGGPPCQGFSKNVPRKYRFLESSNNRQVLTFLHYAEAFRPKMVLMENVAEMKNGFEQTYTDEIIERLSKAGYAIAHGVLNAADYGVPQRRRRTFFIAWQHRYSFVFPVPTHEKFVAPQNPELFHGSPAAHVTVWDAIGDLPSIGHDEKHEIFEYKCDPFTEFQRRIRRNSQTVTNHTPRFLRSTQYERLASLLPGQGHKDLPKHLRPKSGYSGAYGRLTKDMIAPTITRWVFHPGSGRFGHPVDIRVLTIREAARLQGFPDVFEFVGSYTQQAGQVGNAVPPMLIEKVARTLLSQAGYSASDDGFAIPASSSINLLSDNRSVERGKRNVIA